MTERQIALRTRLRDANRERRLRKPAQLKARKPVKPPRVLLTAGQRADVSRANLIKATASRSSNRMMPEPIRSVWWLAKS